MRILERFTPIFLIAGVGFFALSLIGMGLLPWATLARVRAPAPIAAYSPLEQRGRAIYIAEACWHCHTMFVRPVAGEPERYGPPSRAEESLRDIPQLFGTRRVGPDLAREAGRRPDDWHLAHLYNPRHTTPWSIMPGFPWLFSRAADGRPLPTEDARALVAFLQSQGRLYAASRAAEDEAWRASFRTLPPPLATAALRARGTELYARECAGCHGSAGDGRSEASRLLRPTPENLAAIEMRPGEAFRIVSSGVPGSAMPGFREYRDDDRWALAFQVGALYRSDPPAAADPALRARGRQLFAASCTACHGVAGRGDGPAGLALRPPAPNFEAYRPNVSRIVEVLAAGRPGTAMAPFPQLAAGDRRALAEYIRSLYRAE